MLPELTTDARSPPPSCHMQALPSATAMQEHNSHLAAAKSLSTPLEEHATFKLVCVGDGGTVKVDGADLAAWARRSAAANSNLDLDAGGSPQNRSGADEQLWEETDDADVDIMCESCDEDEQLLADVSKAVSQNHHSHGSQVPPSSSTAPQVDSHSSQLLMSDAGRDAKPKPDEVEKAVVTNRDILLRAVQKRRRDVGDRSFYIDPSLDYMGGHSSKVRSTKQYFLSAASIIL